MDNKLTKKRLSDFLSYEWIIILVAIIAAIFVLELIYTVSATRITTGQKFTFYLDQDIYTYESSDKDIFDLLGVNTGENGKTFSR